ncbi:MAG TPA: aspartyl protease family protein [Chthoniobacterales bacterium]|nr:aspartyl protease family protein [Chthoniobacterales bacterium]
MIPRGRLLAVGAQIILPMVCAVGLSIPVAANAASRSQTPTLAQSGQFEALPLVRSAQNHLLVHAYINNKPALLIVDSGSPGTVIASKRRKHFGVSEVPVDSKYPSRVRVNGSYNALVMAHTLRLGGLTVGEVPAISADLSGARRAAQSMHELQADGILGTDVLFASRAVLDCQRKLLILNLQPDLASPVPGLDFSGFQKVPMFVSEGFNLYVNGLVNGSQARLMVDTGAFATLLHRPFVKRLHIPTEQTRLASAAINMKEEGLDVARIKRLSVGMVDIGRNDVGVVDLGGILNEAMQLSPPAVGLLGAEILDRHHGIIDFGTRTLYLKKT